MVARRLVYRVVQGTILCICSILLAKTRDKLNMHGHRHNTSAFCILKDTSTCRERPLETMGQREERLRRVCEKYDDPGRWGTLCAVHNCGDNSDHLKGGV